MEFFGPQMALAYRLDVISQGPKNSIKKIQQTFIGFLDKQHSGLYAIKSLYSPCEFFMVNLIPKSTSFCRHLCHPLAEEKPASRPPP